MEENSKKLTNLDQIGEFGLIDLITKDFEIINDTTELSVGDDAAILDHKSEKSIVTTDMLVEGVHFDLSYFPLKHLGYKAVVASISDICAMNGISKQITVSIAVSILALLLALTGFGLWTAFGPKAAKLTDPWDDHDD